MALGSGICKGLGVTEAWAKGREGSVKEVGLGGPGEGQWGGGNCLVGRGKNCESRVREGKASKRSNVREQSDGQIMETTEWDGVWRKKKRVKQRKK